MAEEKIGLFLGILSSGGQLQKRASEIKRGWIFSEIKRGWIFPKIEWGWIFLGIKRGLQKK